MWIASAAADETVKIWDAKSGALLHNATGYADEVRSLAFSADSRWLETREEKSGAHFLDPASGKEPVVLPGNVSAQDVLKSSEDGRTLVVRDLDKSIRLVEVSTGNEIGRLPSNFKVDEIVAFSGDGKLLAEKRSYNAVLLWDVEAGHELTALTGHTDLLVSEAFSPDGHWLASGSDDHTIKLWDLATGRNLRVLAGHTDYVESVVFSRDSQTLVSSSGDHSIKMWDVASGKLIRTLTGHTDKVWKVVFSSDDRLLASASDDKTVRIWNASTGALVKTIAASRDDVQGVAFSPDGRWLASGSGDKTIKIWDTATWAEQRTLTGHTDVVFTVAFSRDSQLLASCSQDRMVKIWNVATGKEVKTLKGHGDNVFSVMFSPNGQLLASGGMDRTVRLWDVATGNEIAKFFTPGGSISSVAFSANGRWLVGSGWDGSTHLWEVSTKREVAKLVALDKQDWAVVDPIGRFDASPGGMELVHWVVGNEPIAAHQLEERYFDPGLLAKVLGFGEEKPRDVSKFDRVALFPEVQFDGPVDAAGKMKLKLVNRGGGIGKVEVFVNDKELVADARGSKLNPQASDAEITVNLAGAPVSHGRPNTIRVVAWNEEGYLASPGDSITWTPSGTPDTRAPEFYAIISGISNYSSPAIQRLVLPDSDAEEMAHALQLGANRMFGAQHVHITVLSTSHHAGALAPTKENLKKAFEDAQHSKLSDVFVVYLAGHGVAVDDLYAYPTVEAPSLTFSDRSVLASTSVTSEELVEWIKKVPARHQVMILDTCAAGAAAEKLTKRGMSGDQVRAIERLKDRTGFYVLMGSAADAASYEASQYGHGFLTYALLQGMKGAALKEGGFVDVDTLFQYAEDDVPVLARDIGAIQKPLIAAPQANSFEVGRLLEADKAAIHLASMRPMLERPVLLNADEGGDTLQLVAALRKRLRDENYSPRGGESDDSGSAVFVDKDDVSGAILPSGTYTVQGKNVAVKIGLWRDGKKLGNLTVSGTTDNLRALVDQMAEEIAKAVMQMAAASGSKS